MNWKSPSFGLYGNLARAIFLSLTAFLLMFVWLYLLSKSKINDRKPLKIYVAASLADAMEQVVNDFNQQQNSKVVIARVGGSGDLCGQVQLELKTETGEGADILVTADDGFLQSMQDSGDIQTLQVLAFQTLVLAAAVPNQQNPTVSNIKSIDDLIHGGLRYGIASQEAAAGKMIRKLAGDQAVQLESNAKLQTENVMALGQALQLGQLDAAVVWQSVVEQLNRHSEIANGEPKTLIVIKNLGDESRANVTLARIRKQQRSEQNEEQLEDFSRYLTINTKWKNLLRSQGFVVPGLPTENEAAENDGSETDKVIITEVQKW